MPSGQEGEHDTTATIPLAALSPETIQRTGRACRGESLGFGGFTCRCFATQRDEDLRTNGEVVMAKAFESLRPDCERLMDVANAVDAIDVPAGVATEAAAKVDDILFDAYQRIMDVVQDICGCKKSEAGRQ